MSNIRLKTNINKDNFVKLKLEQEFDFIEVLSLKLSQEDVYRKFSSDYGVVVGRVVVNAGYGVPNAKVSVFIPIDDADKNDPEILGLYPYEVVTDTDSAGIRYNLLPKNGDPSNSCSTPIGTFSSKREILDNDVLTKIYSKYYKFTTTTNHAGDFMFFGVPVGNHVIHMDTDISDMDIISQRPYDLISQGTPKENFASSTKFKGGNNLNALIQLKSLNASVNVIPFWGDSENDEIGITRLDFNLNQNIIPSAIFMGSIYGDSDKNSVNKQCRPRPKMGAVCEQTTGEGTIQMIRKTFFGGIERFDIEGGNLIDENGTWAYQIPMNLDYVITDEEGNLSFSQDPNIGIPTRASVRFNIGMNETGDEGRIRTRARYLVPNNPTNQSQIDYEFGELTKDTSFRELYWNKIYTVSNFIPRYQTVKSSILRAYTAIKDVDECSGDKTPFPYNRVDIQTNPIFFIICIIMTIIAALVTLINSVVIQIMNSFLQLINGFFKTLCRIKIIRVRPFGFACKLISDYIACIGIDCPEENKKFAPGCRQGSKGWDALGNAYSNSTAGLIDCIAFKMAQQLNLFKFNFQNDWVHGSLYTSLLKYKKRKKKRNRSGVEKFCEYECSGGNFTPSNGVDANNNGSPDNRCHTNYLVDSCYPTSSNSQKEERMISLKEGVVKKLNDELFYGATTHNTAYKMFATDIVCLGAVMECDWQGIPKINQFLVPTTYKIPPDTREVSDEGVFESCGQVSLGGDDALFFEIDCAGLHLTRKGAINMRHLCEMGVTLDDVELAPNGTVIQSPNCNIGTQDMDNDSGKWFRDVFFGLNRETSTPWVEPRSLAIPSAGYSTNFNLSNTGEYDFTSKDNNGSDYIDFRGYPINSSNIFSQPKNSFYFYFGILPGRSALDTMNLKFFAPCTIDYIAEGGISVSTVDDINLTDNGQLSITFIGSNTSFDYEVIGLNYYFSGTSLGNETQVINNLKVGEYTVSAVDKLSVYYSKTVRINGAPELSAFASVTKNSTTTSSNDGQITITSVNGGVGPYTYTVYKYAIPYDSGQIIAGPAPLSVPQIINNIPYDNTNGHTVKVTDSKGATFYVPNLIVTASPILSLLTDKTDESCPDMNDGSIRLTITGGLPPYTILTTSTDFESQSINMENLGVGSYVTTVTDLNGVTVSYTTNIISPNPKITVEKASPSVLLKQCSTTNHILTFYVEYSSNPPANVQIVKYNEETDEYNNFTTLPYVNKDTALVLTLPKNLDGFDLGVQAGACVETLGFDYSEIALPSQVLDGSITKSGPVSGNYTYIVSGFGGIGSISGTGTFVSTASTYSTTIYDSVGCSKYLSI